MEAIKWKNEQLFLLDQTKLPLETVYLRCTDYLQVAEAIKRLAVRGAPAIGIAAAFGMVLAAIQAKKEKEPLGFLKKANFVLASTRPTAVNLFWALQRIERIWQNEYKDCAVKMLAEAKMILKEDIEINHQLSIFGETLIPDQAGILTHCNAGAIATGGYGTALGMIRKAFENQKKIHVFADETRPLLQGARLTTYELMKDNIPVTLLTDNMAAYAMQQGMIDLVIVGADRITAAGDVANKIGTYGVAVLAKYHKIPFYVAAPTSTFDLNLQEGGQIPIEERSAEEVRSLSGQKIAPPDVSVLNPAFDVTPHELIKAIITEKGIINEPNEKNVGKIVKEG